MSRTFCLLAIALVCSSIIAAPPAHAPGRDKKGKFTDEKLCLLRRIDQRLARLTHFVQKHGAEIVGKRKTLRGRRLETTFTIIPSVFQVAGVCRDCPNDNQESTLFDDRF